MSEMHTIHVEYDEKMTRRHIEWWAACDSDAYSHARACILACRKWLDEHPEQPEWFTDPRDGTIIDQAGRQYHFLDGAWHNGWGNPVDINPSGWTLLFRPPAPDNRSEA